MMLYLIVKQVYTFVNSLQMSRKCNKSNKIEIGNPSNIMPVDKQVLLRYHVLNKCFINRYREYTITM